jgi:hypothetical protein
MALNDILGVSGESRGFVVEIEAGSTSQAIFDILIDTELTEAGVVMEVAEQPPFIKIFQKIR